MNGYVRDIDRCGPNGPPWATAHIGTYAHDLIELDGVQIALDFDSEVVYDSSIFCPRCEKRRPAD